jgi:hypothetical protein
MIYGQYIQGCLIVKMWEGIPVVHIEEVEAPKPKPKPKYVEKQWYGMTYTEAVRLSRMNRLKLIDEKLANCTHNKLAVFRSIAHLLCHAETVVADAKYDVFDGYMGK